MALVISEIVSEVTLSGTTGTTGPAGTAALPGGSAAPTEEELLERVVRRAVERVLEQLRREWEV